GRGAEVLRTRIGEGDDLVGFGGDGVGGPRGAAGTNAVGRSHAEGIGGAVAEAGNGGGARRRPGATAGGAAGAGGGGIEGDGRAAVAARRGEGHRGLALASRRRADGR